MAIMTLAGKNAIRANQILQCKKDCSEQGISVTQWCREHGLSEKSYWYYHKKLGDALYDVALYEGEMDNLVLFSRESILANAKDTIQRDRFYVVFHAEIFLGDSNGESWFE